jgi:DNA-3-methyladenine glycosylase
MSRLTRGFFEQKTLIIAQQLLGCFLIRKIGKKIIKARIIETESYVGPKDLASHASKGRTARTEVMFGSPGRAYVYLIYGMYYCFNIVTEKEDYPAAILIRGIEVDGVKIIGPGKVCRALKIDKHFNNQDLIKSHELWLQQDRLGVKSISPRLTRLGREKLKVRKLPRVNIDYAGEYKNKLWRFILLDNY